jgi:hypothetical protein
MDTKKTRTIEACWNWGPLYDLLGGPDGEAKVVLSHPAKNRIIADAQIKNDRVDAKALATLLRGDFVARVHVPSISRWATCMKSVAKCRRGAAAPIRNWPGQSASPQALKHDHFFPRWSWSF